jgi:hypothetical protein
LTRKNESNLQRRGYRFQQKKNDLQRCDPRQLRTGNTFLIVTEGAETEPNYLYALLKRLNIRSAQVRVAHPPFTDPEGLVQSAIRYRDEATKSHSTVAYDEVWVVCDREAENHPTRKQQIHVAKQLCDPQKIKLVVSNPSIEYWLLLHEEFTTAAFSDADKVKKRLKKHWKDFDKNKTPSTAFIEKVPTAVKHAEHCRTHHAKDSKSKGNPSTDMDLLIRSLNDAAHVHDRFDLNR